MGRGPYGDPIGSGAWDKQLASGGLLRGKLRCRQAMAERFRQVAEAPIPRTFVTDSLGCQASKDGDACPILAVDKGQEELFASTDRAPCVDGLDAEWLAGDAASL